MVDHDLFTICLAEVVKHFTSILELKAIGKTKIQKLGKQQIIWMASSNVGVILLMHLLSCQAFDFESNQSHTTAPSKSKTTIGLLIDETTTNVLTNQTEDADFETSTIQTSTGETVTPAVYTMTSFSTGTSICSLKSLRFLAFSASGNTKDACFILKRMLRHRKMGTNSLRRKLLINRWDSLRMLRESLPLWIRRLQNFMLEKIYGDKMNSSCFLFYASERAPMQAKTVDRTSFTDTFHKPEPGAVYVDPSLYYGTLCRTTLTPSRLSSGGGGRPRLNLESFENSHYQEQQQISPSRNNDDKNMEHYHSPHKNRNSYNETRIDDDSPPLPRHVLES
uniref:Uncharacterized protein n=1 Tax=Romanomermis culicivorax TaxID=13658 RepID=A0A915K848_ROMCU